MVTDQNNLSDSTPTEQEVIRYIYKDISPGIWTKRAKCKKKRVKRLERDVRFLKVELEDLDECVDRKTVSS
ncbi:hypothetical protein C1646_777400 [Rhizophagus diaphanus]|nr:hypothetical protein C1646_777400 [Rhizophagus diaphanus] [Rhizophagus sp. MUCL 43196]